VCSTFSKRPFIFLLQSIVFGARHGRNGMTTEYWESCVILRQTRHGRSEGSKQQTALYSVFSRCVHLRYGAVCRLHIQGDADRGDLQPGRQPLRTRRDTPTAVVVLQKGH